MNLLIKNLELNLLKRKNQFLQLKNLTISYGNRQIVEGLNLNIQRSEISGLLGPNGAGKSSIYHSIIGLVKPTFGKILINGEDVTNIPTHIRCSEIWYIMGSTIWWFMV